MAVIVLTAAKGSPGVTTTALALTLVWPRPVLLVEADVAGGSSILAGWLRATVVHEKSLLDAVIAHRRGGLADRLHALTIPLPPDDDASTKRLLPAIPQAVHAAALEPLWVPLASLLSALDDAGTDVIVDAGRLGAQHGPMPLLRAADAVLLITRATLPAVAAVAARLPLLRDELTANSGGEDALALVTIGQPAVGASDVLYSAREISRALGAPVLGTISHDPVGAEVLCLGSPPPLRFDRSGVMRSARSVADAAAHLARRHRDRVKLSAAPAGLGGSDG